MIPFLADAVTAPDPMISGNWIITLIGALVSGAALLLGKAQGKKEAREKRSVTLEDQPISFAHQSPAATQAEVGELKRDMDGRLSKIETALAEERSIARNAIGNLHARIDKSTEALAEVKGEIRQIGDNVSRLLELAMNPRKPTSRG